MQPTYLPWAGYFNLIDSVDEFVFLDDVQFEHQSWQTRNWILARGTRQMLVVPVSRASLKTRICDIAISNSVNWRRKHWTSLREAYSRAPHGAALLSALRPSYEGPETASLSELNQSLVHVLCNGLGIATPLRRATEFRLGGERSAHLLEICAALACDEYLSPLGSAGYLAEDRFKDNGRVKLQFQDFAAGPYPQRGNAGFVSHLSMVDVIANIGWDGAAKYAKGRAAHE